MKGKINTFFIGLAGIITTPLFAAAETILLPATALTCRPGKARRGEEAP